MICRVQKLTRNIHVVRGYRRKHNIKHNVKYDFICTLYRDNFFVNLFKNKKIHRKWIVLVTMSQGGKISEIKETIAFLKHYPGGVYTYVSAQDLKRFYQKYCFGKVEFKNCKEYKYGFNKNE